MSKRGAYIYQQIEQTTAEWTADSTIYPPSLWLFERLTNGNLNMKFSDGVHTYADLPLMMQDIKVRIKTDTDTEYVLEITSAEGTITTPNLRDHYDDTDIRNLVTGLRTDVDKLKPVVTSTPSNGQITITPDKAKNEDPDVSITLETKGDKDKSLMADGNYRKLPVYGRNLLLGSGKEVSNSNQNIANYWLVEQIPEGTQVTVTVWGDLGEGIEFLRLYNSGGSVTLISFNRNNFENGKTSRTFNWNIKSPSGESTADNTRLSLFVNPVIAESTSTIHKIKLEYGDISTEWTPAWEDIPDIEERYAYGTEWDMASSSPDGKRVGNMQLHRDLPVQSGMIRCIIDNNGGIVRYNDEAVDDILTQSAMVEIPEHWFKLYTNGTKFKAMFSAIPLPGYNHIDKFYISTMEARIYRNNSTLFSSKGVNSTDSSVRGGDNTADWDGTYRSLLGRPVTNLTRDQFRQAARKRGSGWEMYTYNAHKTLFWLFAVEYATLDSQKPFNAQKDANGFAQGGLGPGPTQMTDWTNFNNANPLSHAAIPTSSGTARERRHMW
ncbi:hypothetical protein [Parabacteroides distasonis]|uniref:hypothetical protein n=1 Tax=Parabacteroides distasonis TaxID=823 RepID=UPI000E3687A5|nr:hypothetical protein [Parabacteroides distasonis]REC35553.1 hypothetical protein CF162_19905 [Parabacteroides distasonis]